MTPKQTSTWQTKLNDAIRRDPKKACVLGVLALVLAVMGGRLVIGKSTPATAGAGPITQKKLKGGDEVELKPSGKKDGGVAMQRWLTSSPGKIDRNLFAIRLEYYPRLSIKAIGKSGKTDPANPGEEGKSTDQAADDLKEWHARSEALQQQAQQLRLQTTVMSATPQVLINGQMLKEGDVIEPAPGDSSAGFRVLKIEPRRVIVEREGIKLEILMK